MPMAGSKSEQIKDIIMQSGVWHLGAFVFASGKEANNKFEIPAILEREEVAEPLMRELGYLALEHSPDALWGVPSGGQEIACYLGGELGLPVVCLEKKLVTPGKKSFEYASRGAERLAQQATRIVGVEDITTEFTSLMGALELPVLRSKTQGIVSVWRRGTPDIERDIGIPVSWLAEEAVPNMITPNQPFYKKYAHLAVKHDE
jgi:orotate phosphoribosyltransferase